jgi:hypothetical protein
MRNLFLLSASLYTASLAILPQLFAQAQQNEIPPPVFRVNVVAHSTKAINYRHRSGSTEISFPGTAAMPKARGQAKVDSRQGAIAIDASLRDVGPPNQFGTEYVTYVLWAVSPEGRPKNLGEILLDGARALGR